MSDIDFDAVFSRIPMLRHASPSHFTIKPLPGLSNHNFHLRHSTDDYVLRIPKPETNRHINRAFEAFNIDRVTDLGLAPEVLWRDPDGLSLTSCLVHTQTVSTANMHDETFWPLLINRLDRLHRADFHFQGEINLVTLLNRYFELIPRNLYPDLKPCFEKALTIHSELQTEDTRCVPSHNDLVLENLLIGGEQELWLIDWEYSAMASPYWDLATLCNAGRLGQDQSRRFLELYGEAVIKLEFDYLRRYQYLLQVLTIAWLANFSPHALDSEISWLTRLKV